MNTTKAIWVLAVVTGLSAACNSAETSRQQRMDTKLQERFAAADKDANGYITAEEASGKMPRVAKHFDEIDTSQRGSVTLDEIRAYMSSRVAEKE